MYRVYGNSSWCIDCSPLYGRYLLLGVSINRGSTVLLLSWASVDWSESANMTLPVPPHIVCSTLSLGDLGLT